MAGLRFLPAIDLRQGQVVRLSQGRFDDMRVYGSDPVAQAAALEAEGATYLHVVDLDAAKGDGNNRGVVEAIVRSVKARVQLGGGLDSMAAISQALDSGVWRVVVGSAALRNPDLVAEAVKAFGERFCVGLDARQGRVQVSGWRAESGHGLSEAGRLMAERGVGTLVVTNIERDGMLNGPDLTGAIALGQETGCAIVVSGGVSSLDDLRQIAAAGTQSRIEGVIVGKALYEGRVTVADSLAVLRGAGC